MKITYISHSGFLAETEKYVFLFDYFKGEIPEIPKDKLLIVFASHNHHDHFNKEIFELAKKYDKILFILSKDIKMTEKFMERLEIPKEAFDKIIYIGKNETKELKVEDGVIAKDITKVITNDIRIETLTSTDQGVAFIITADGKTIYHAGDLNWWTWIGESKAEYTEMTNAFKREMKKIEGREFDVAFVPLDPRQEERFYWGFDYFLRTTKTKVAFPMHCWDDYSVIKKLILMDESKPYRDCMMEIDREGQSFVIE